MTIIPDSAEMGGTVRLFDQALRKKMPSMMEETIRGITAAFSAAYDFRYIHGYPATVNDPEFTALACSAARAILGSENVRKLQRPRPGISRRSEQQIRACLAERLISFSKECVYVIYRVFVLLRKKHFPHFPVLQVVVA